MRIALALVALLVIAAPLQAADTPTPEETVKEYLTAFKAGDFNKAYPLVTHAMAQNKSKDDWVKEQQWMMQMAEVKIFEFHVYPGKIDGDKAFVPNVLSSQDKFLNQLGADEYELYTLVKENGEWKIDQQEIVEKSEQAKWFTKKAS